MYYNTSEVTGSDQPMPTDAEIMEAVKKYLPASSRMGDVEGATQIMLDSLRTLEGDQTGMLLTGLGTRHKGDMIEGDDLDDPSDLWGEGKIWEEETQKLGGTRVQVKLGLDCSQSMMGAEATRGHAPYHIGSDAETEYLEWQTQQSELIFMPRVFSASLVARSVYKTLTKFAEQFGADLEFKGYVFGIAEKGVGGGYKDLVHPYEGQVWIRHPLHHGTPYRPLLNAFREDEMQTGDLRAAKLDIIISDGDIQFDSGPTGEVARLQRDRMVYGGETLRTFVVCIMTPSEYQETFGDMDYAEVPPAVTYVNAGTAPDTVRVLHNILTDFIMGLAPR